MRRFVGTSRVKTLAVPETNQSILMDMAYGIVESRQQNGCFKKFEDVRETGAGMIDRRLNITG